jgi:lipopolysaccharide export system permease protein
MSADNEVIAMRAAGVSFPRTLAPVAAVSIICLAVSAWLALNILHKGNYRFNSQIASYVSSRISTALGEGVFFDKFPNTVIYVKKKPVEQPGMKGIFIYDGSDRGKPRFITAETGELATTKSDNISLTLTNGTIYSGDGKAYRLINYGKYEVLMDIGSGRRHAFVKGEREMSAEEIWEQIRSQRAKNIPTYGEEVELYKRFSLPLACLVLGLLGAPLGVHVHRGGKWGGVGMGILMIVLNYVLLMVGEGLGRQGNLPPLLALMMPNIIMGLLAAYLIYRTSRELAPFNFIFWSRDARRNIANLFGRGKENG